MGLKNTKIAHKERIYNIKLKHTFSHYNLKYMSNIFFKINNITVHEKEKK